MPPPSPPSRTPRWSSRCAARCARAGPVGHPAAASVSSAQPRRGGFVSGRQRVLVLGGIGGEAGLARWLVERSIHRVIDATHPFAATITSHAARATTQVHVPLLVLRRRAWVAGQGDQWHEVGSLQEAARILPDLGRRPLLTTGRQGVDAFAGLDDLAFVVRTVDPPDVPLPRRHTLLLDRGP